MLSILLLSGFADAAECVAHRGNNVAQLENSLTAIQSALDVGARAIEFDVHHLADGTAILMHDDTLRRTAQGSGQHACPLEEPLHTLTVDQVRGPCILQNGEEIPLLSEALDLFEGTGARPVIELKDRPSAQTIQLLKDRYPDGEGAILISFEAEALDDVADVGLPRLHLGVARAKVNGYDGVDVHWTRLPAGRRTRRKGKELAAWTIDDPRQMERLARSGVGWITTNDPALCLQVMSELDSEE